MTTTYTANTAWDYLIANEIASEETLKIITSVNGYSLDTLQDVTLGVTLYQR
jgi:hypothetical protein